jgi:hypothetical protein
MTKDQEAALGFMTRFGKKKKKLDLETRGG